MRRLSLDHARRIALAAQGLHRPRPAGPVDVRHLRRVVRDVDVVQLDSVNVLARSHYLPFFSRLGRYDRSRLDAWLWRSRELFEGWIHVASVMPMAAWPLLRHRHDGIHPWARVQRVFERHPGYVEAVREEVARRGPTSVGDLDDPGSRDGPWWGVPKGRSALDWLFMAGQLAVHDRSPTFVTSYDLTERVIPGSVRDAEAPPAGEATRHLLLRAARAHGVGTAPDLADYHRLPIVAARAELARMAERGELAEVAVDGWRQPAYLHPEAHRPRRVRARALLSPFDSLVWFRDRTERLFDFRYRVEIYVPAAKRVHGYYVLPFLLGERLVGRVDLKADRAAGALRVRGAFAEDGVDRSVVARELAAELTELAGFLDLGEVVVADHGDLAPHLRRALP